MANDNQNVIKDASNKIPMPQFKDAATGEMKLHKGNHAPYQQLIDNNGNPISASNGLNVQIAGSSLQEQKTQTDAVTGTLTFSQNIQFIEIYNRDTVNDGVFNVNGINITVPKGESVDFSVGGTPRATVTVTGSTSYIVSRFS